jgi:hypothetical protein
MVTESFPVFPGIPPFPSFRVADRHEAFATLTRDTNRGTLRSFVTAYGLTVQGRSRVDLYERIHAALDAATLIQGSDAVKTNTATATETDAVTGAETDTSTATGTETGTATVTSTDTATVTSTTTDTNIVKKTVRPPSTKTKTKTVQVPPAGTETVSPSTEDASASPTAHASLVSQRIIGRCITCNCGGSSKRRPKKEQAVDYLLSMLETYKPDAVLLQEFSWSIQVAP